MYSITFQGACGTVTGSKYLMEIGGKMILIDCGLFQGTHAMRDKNWDEVPVDPASLDAIILTHAHIDHSGYVPRMVRMGFSGPVYCTRGTAALLQILWPDAGELQEEEAFYANKKKYSRFEVALPLFTEKDARRSLKLLHRLHFGDMQEIFPGIKLTFRRVGHILGAASVHLSVKRSRGESHHWVFSGDLGRPDHPILKPPEPFFGSDFLLMESTYGKRFHSRENTLDVLCDVVKHTLGKSGVLIIPAFAVGRSQEILYYLRRLKLDHRIPENIPIYIDSPMSLEALQLYRQFHKEHNIELSLMEHEGVELMSGPYVFPVRKISDSKSLNNITSRAIIISASGMCNGGRIEHHLKRKLPEPNNTLLFVGYQAHGTRGRQILEGEDFISLHGQEIPIRAEIKVMNSLSAHADADELIYWLNHKPAPEPDVFITHGEDDQREGLRDNLKTKLGWDATIPAPGQSVNIP